VTEAQRELPRVLVLEDPLVTSSHLGALLSEWGYQVEYADAFHEVQRLAQERLPQITLATWAWRGIPSTELCRRIRRLDLQMYSYIILILNDIDDVDMVEALASGADEVLRWPVDDGELEARLHSAVRRVGLHKRLHVQTAMLTRAHEVIAQDLRTVSTLQRSYLPPTSSPYTDVDYQWLSLPSMYVSGDHLNVFHLNQHQYAFYLLDLAGHGISAAVKSMQLVQLLSDHSDNSLLFDGPAGFDDIRQPSSPSTVVSRLNALIQQTEAESFYFTMIYGVLDTQRRKVSFCQAGHPSPIVLRQGQSARLLKGSGYPVGLFDGVDYEDTELQLEADDVFLLYSDGVTEVWSDQQEAFGEERLLDSINRLTSQPSERGLLLDLAHTIETWGGRVLQRLGFQDDVSILALSLAGASPITQAADHEAYTPSSLGPVFRPEQTQGLLLQDLYHTRRKVLLVDDSRSFLKIFEAMLTNWGYQVLIAQSGQEALALIDREQPDFILSDWDMPNMSGIELCQHVRSQQQHAYIYIIMITGYASKKDLLHSLRVGADDFLSKPVNPQELKVRLGTASRIGRLQQSLIQHHQQLQHFYDVLERDLMEVSRIQQALLPNARTEPWPCAFQGLYHRALSVSGLQWGLLDTRPNEFGFFMVSMPSHDLSQALQAMAFSRCLSTPQATQVLLRDVDHLTKQQRLLENPREACQQAMRMSSSFIQPDVPATFFYGLLNENLGVLLLAGVGRWRVFIGQPQQTGVLKDVDCETGNVIHEGPLQPGDCLFCLPTESAEALGLHSLEDWQRQLNASVQESTIPCVAWVIRHLEKTIQSNNVLNAQNLMCVGVQWREHFEHHVEGVQPKQFKAWHPRFLNIAQQLSDSLAHFDQSVALGPFLKATRLTAVCDTQNIAHTSLHVRSFLEGLHYTEQLCYNVDLAVSEYLTNIMEHAFSGVRPKPIELAIFAYQGAVGVRVQDMGSPIPASVFEQVANSNRFHEDLAVEELPEGGMGLLFMRMMSKRFLYESDGGVNTLWLLL
jgi:sigma-B regulation protein RsbU (phosphoserine phosphatase)